MVILFFICLVLLIVIALFAIEPIMRAINSGIAKHNEKIKEKKIKQEEKERKEAELEAIRRENVELKEKLKRETYINEVRTDRDRDNSVYSSLTPPSIDDSPYYDWGLDEPVGLKIRKMGGWFY